MPVSITSNSDENVFNKYNLVPKKIMPEAAEGGGCSSSVVNPSYYGPERPPVFGSKNSCKEGGCGNSSGGECGTLKSEKPGSNKSWLDKIETKPDTPKPEFKINPYRRGEEPIIT